MYKVAFYRDKNGEEPVKKYIKDLLCERNHNKESRVRLNKIQDYIKVLQEKGTFAGEPYVKYMGDEIWELRPLKERVFFFMWAGNTYILLHHYHKKTQKTPKRELVIARKRKKDFEERMKAHE